MFRHYKAIISILLFQLFIFHVEFETPSLRLTKPIETQVIKLVADPVLPESVDDEVGRNLFESLAYAISNKYKGISYPEALKVVDIVFREAPKSNLEPELVLSVIANESSFRRVIDSHAGAKGYMQLIPKWHQDKIRGRNVYDTKVNITSGIAYLSECIEKRGGRRGGLACYNGAVTPSKIDEYNYRINKGVVEMGNLIASI